MCLPRHPAVAYLYRVGRKRDVHSVCQRSNVRNPHVFRFIGVLRAD
jgi:hypothetical protein